MRFRSDIWSETIYFYMSDIWKKCTGNSSTIEDMSSPYDLSKDSTHSTLYATCHYWIEEQGHYTINEKSGVNEILDEKHVRTLFEQYIIPKYWDRYAIFCQEEWEDMIEECCKFLNKLIGWVSATYTNYAKRIDFYDKTTLEVLNPIKTSGDTYTNTSSNPNVAITDSSLTGEVNVTNTEGTHSETQTDGATLAARYAEADAAMRNLYESWLTEFDRHFAIYKNVV